MNDLFSAAQNSSKLKKKLSLYLITFATTFYLIFILPSGKYAKIAKENQNEWQQYQTELQEIWKDYNFQRSQKLKFIGKTKILDYKEIDDFFIELLKLRKPEIKMEMFAKNPEFYKRYKKLTENISPWKILDSDPKNTLLPYVHVPKTAGSTFRGFLHENTNSHSTAKKWPYRNQIYPSFTTNSWNSPGCRPFSWGGTHCGFAELDSCLKNDYANLYSKNSKSTEKYFQTWPRPHPRPASLNSTLISKYKNNIKYFSIIRNPIKRVISEYYWWKPEESQIQKNWGCGHPAWSPDLCWESRNVKSWTKSIFNSAHNRQMKSLYPMKIMQTNNKNTKTYPIYPENLKFDNEMDKECTNLNGQKDYKFITYGNYNGSNSVATLNKNFNALIETIENIEKNFSFIAIFEKMKVSVEMAKIVLNFTNPDGVQMTKSKKRIKRQLHSSSLNRPKKFSIGLLTDIFERNLLDMLLWDYLDQKFEISVEYYEKL